MGRHHGRKYDEDTAMQKKEQSYGYRSIRKPQPVKSLRMKDWFSLTTSSPSAEVKPPKMKLRYDNTTPNFFEVFIEDADVDFSMKLISDVEGEIVWDHTIQRADFRHKTTQNAQSAHLCKALLCLADTFDIQPRTGKRRERQIEDSFRDPGNSIDSKRTEGSQPSIRIIN
ncbi:uncharacterized protein LOC109906197 isoform X3 [Oncorhynchus kisutch]|uniref:uncharacterized protein LOC109906197 isoform X3 n=1 Tax=Oncorhynchus kisutch TaxID=8019 RepID=UPI0012DFA40B|nr:uncharacterized protein LOC109906197 isoform X3 [Oncorhynchus kisutch]